MKKILAVILAFAMLFSVATICSSAEENPKVSIVTNQGSSVVQGTEILFTVKFDNFESIQGMDVDVTVTKASGLDLVEATGFTFAGKTVINENYKTDGTTLKLVDLTGAVDGKLIFKVTPNAVGATVSVDGEYAEDGINLADVDGSTATLDVVATAQPEKEETEDATTELAQPADEDVFIPYGSVVDAEGNFAPKDAETGSFTLDSSKKYTYSVFKKPSAAAGLTTYGVSNEANDTTKLRFGTYSVQADTYNHGTLIFEGDWEALKNHYIKQGHSVQAFVKAIYKHAKGKIGNYSYVSYNIAGVGIINVYIVKQSKVMWQSSNGKDFEYSVRINNAAPGKEYTGVAYSYSKSNENDIKISDNARTKLVAAS